MRFIWDSRALRDPIGNIWASTRALHDLLCGRRHVQATLKYPLAALKAASRHGLSWNQMAVMQSVAQRVRDDI